MTTPVVTVRPATMDDAERLWEWRNEAGMRRASFHGDLVPLEDHRRWLTKALSDPKRWLFVGEIDAATPAGYVRFDAVGDEAEISVTVDASLRGRGVGPMLIRAAVDALARVRPDLRPVALVKTDNPASQRAFVAAGFVQDGERAVHGASAIVYRFVVQEGMTR